MSIEEYAEQFITSSDRRLIDTIDHPTDSDPNAVAAAQQELERRGLSEAQLTEIRSELDGKEKIRSNRNTKLDLLAQQTTATAKELGQTFIVDPDQSRMERRQLRIMMIALGVMLIPDHSAISRIAIYAGWEIGPFRGRLLFPTVPPTRGDPASVEEEQGRMVPWRGNERLWRCTVGHIGLV